MEGKVDDMNKQNGFIFPFTALMILVFFLAISLSADKLAAKIRFYELLAEKQAMEVLVQRSMSDILIEIKDQGTLSPEGSLKYPAGTAVFTKDDENSETITVTIFVSGKGGGRMNIRLTVEKADGSVIAWREGV